MDKRSSFREAVPRHNLAREGRHFETTHGHVNERPSLLTGAPTPEAHLSCTIVAEQGAEDQLGAFCTLEG